MARLVSGQILHPAQQGDRGRIPSPHCLAPVAPPAGLSQGELAKRVGVTRQAISQLESPDANLRLSLEKVAEALGLAIDLTLRPAVRSAAG